MKKDFGELYRESGIQRKKIVEVFGLNPYTFDKIIQGEAKIPEEIEDCIYAYLRNIVRMNKEYNKIIKGE